MKSSIYSLVIQDDLIRRIDEIAVNKGMSRSQMINEVLAEYLGISTPEYKINKIMDFICSEFLNTQNIRMISNNKGSSIKLKTNIRYKYNPQLQFMLELKGKNKNKLATLKIQSRTQSEDFLKYLIEFFYILTEIEKYMDIGFRRNRIKVGHFVVDGNRFYRDFYYDWTSDKYSAEKLSRFLINYINMIDEAIGVYFDNLECPDDLIIKIREVYKRHIELS